VIKNFRFFSNLRPIPALRAPRADHRLPQILDAAARLFRSQGFQGISVRDIVRDIVRDVDMLPGSLYYDFATKEDLLAAVYAEGVRRREQPSDRAPVIATLD